MDKAQYQKLQERLSPTPTYLINVAKAFFVGGFICVIGQAVSLFYIIFFDFTEKTAGNPTVATMVFFSMILTGLGLYKRLGQFAGAGSAVPVTGFGNAVISSAIEAKSEGFVLGVGSSIFKIAGAVVLFGTVSAFFVALIKYILVSIGVVSW
ncbi:MAG: stage V sporulation protein AC [Lysinibacillus sp.]